MPKPKIYDIKPPKTKEDIIVEFQEKKPFRPKNKKPGFYILGGLILALVIIWIFLPASSAKIYIFPKTNEVKTEAFLTVDQNIDKIDTLQQRIPGKVFEIEKTVSKVYPSSLVDVSEKAKGIIRVYNKYSTKVILVAGTRFLSATEPSRVFHSTKKIIIPAGGYIDVEVIASEPGEEYNIEPTTFSVPGLRNYSPPQLYYSVFGKSFKKMEGGKTTKVAKVTQEDLDQAKEDLLKIVDQKALEGLKKEVGEEYIILERTFESEIISAEPFDVKVGQLAENFTYQIKIKAKAMGIKKSDLTYFAKHYIDSQTPPEKEIYEPSIKIHTIEENIDLDKTVTLEVQMSAKIYSSLDQGLIKEIAKGQTKAQILKHLNELYPDVSSRSKVKFSPFFTRIAPSNLEKINIEIKVN